MRQYKGDIMLLTAAAVGGTGFVFNTHRQIQGGLCVGDNRLLGGNVGNANAVVLDVFNLHMVSPLMIRAKL